MNRTFLTAVAILAVILSMIFASDTEAQNCPPSGGFPESLSSGLGVRTAMANWATEPSGVTQASRR